MEIIATATGVHVNADDTVVVREGKCFHLVPSTGMAGIEYGLVEVVRVVPGITIPGIVQEQMEMHGIEIGDEGATHIATGWWVQYEYQTPVHGCNAINWMPLEWFILHTVRSF